MRSSGCVALVIGGAMTVVACTGGGDRAVPVVPVTTAVALPPTTGPVAPPEAPPAITEPDQATVDLGAAPPAPPASAVVEPVEPHPLDGLSAIEMAQMRGVLIDAGLVTDQTRYPYVGLHPPDKAAVRSWAPGSAVSRQAEAVLYDLETGAVTTAIVDVTARQLVSSAVAPGLLPGYVTTEFSAAINAAVADERMMDGIAARGVDPATAVCLAFSPGAARSPEEAGRRLVRVSCFETDVAEGSGGIGWSRPIDRLVATVAVDGAAEVLSVVDGLAGGTAGGPADGVPVDGVPVDGVPVDGVPVDGVPVDGAAPAESTIPSADPGIRPVLAVDDPATAGSAVVRGTSAEWAGWELRWRLDRRVGLIVNDVSIDAGWGRVPVLYEASIADLYVPYHDPDPAWSWRTFLDAGEFGLGSALSELTPGLDCPRGATFVSGAVPNDLGDAYTVARAVCLFERPTGPAARHSIGDGAPAIGAPGAELVLRAASTVGNYDYLTDVVFGLDGSIRFEIAAAGIALQRTTVAATNAEFIAAGGDAHGTLVAPGLVGVHHDHFLSFRLDLDVGGVENRVVRRRLGAVAVDGDAGRSAVWATTDEVVGTETAVALPAVPGGEIWRFEGAPRADGSRPAYALDPLGSMATPIVDPTETALAQRAAWAAQPLWLTGYAPTERFAGGDSLPGGAAGSVPAGLPGWVADGAALDGVDVVGWYTLGFHHVVRPEDLPSMPVHRVAFVLRPEGVFPANPITFSS